MLCTRSYMLNLLNFYNVVFTSDVNDAWVNIVLYPTIQNTEYVL